MELQYIRQILEGDVARFSYFVETYKHMAYTLAYRIVYNHEDAEEVVQDAFMRAFRSLSKFKGDSKFSTWFYRIVVNNALSKAKSNSRIKTDLDVEEVSDVLVDDTDSTYKQLGVGEQKRFINQALEKLVPEDRVLLTLYYLNENSIEEVSEITSITAENVKMKLHRARKKLYFILSGILKSEIHNIA